MAEMTTKHQIGEKWDRIALYLTRQRVELGRGRLDRKGMQEWTDIADACRMCEELKKLATRRESHASEESEVMI